MKLIEIDRDFIVHRKYDGAAEVLKPVVFWNGSQYSCLLGPNEEVGLLTVAETPVLALKAWNNALLKRLQIGDENDFIVKYVNDIVGSSSNSEKVQQLSARLGQTNGNSKNL